MATSILFENEQIHSLIPQRKPIIMVDTFFEGSETHAITGLTIQADNLFCRKGVFTEPGLIEHMAQSASAMAGYTANLQQKQAPIGYIGEIKKFRVLRCPDIGETLQTTIHVLSEVLNISLVSADTNVGDELVASCQMKIFIQEK